MLVEKVVSWSHIEKWVAWGWDGWVGLVAEGSQGAIWRRFVVEVYYLLWRHAVQVSK